MGFTHPMNAAFDPFRNKHSMATQERPMPVRTGEILFVKCVKNGIPNRDPLRDSDARRIFGEDDGRISLSDVSIKRDVRDYVLARFPEGSEQEDLTRLVFVQKKFGEDGKTLLGRDGL